MDSPETLLALARRHPIEQNVFVRRLCGGEYTREQLRIYGERFFQLTEKFPCQLAAIVSICPHYELRAHLLENLMEEEGYGPRRNGSGFAYHAERRHAALTRRFAQALGISDAALALAGPAPATPWFDQAVQQGRWLVALAYVSLGVESNVPRTYRLLIPALRRHYGFNDHELSVFIEHVQADEGHGALGAAMVVQAIQTPADRAEAVEGIRRGSTAWWGFLRACDTAIRRRQACDVV